MFASRTQAVHHIGTKEGGIVDAFILLGGLLAFILLDVLALVWGADMREMPPKEANEEYRT